MNSEAPSRRARARRRAGEVRRQSAGDRLAAEGLHRRPRPVERQVERRRQRRRGARASRRAAPRRAGRASRSRCQTREVGVLDRQLGQRRGPAGREGRVERRQLAEQHAHRPAVGDDVVERQQEPVLLCRQPERSSGAQQRPALEVERPVAPPPRPGARPRAPRPTASGRPARSTSGSDRAATADRPPAPALPSRGDEAGAQRLVAAARPRRRSARGAARSSGPAQAHASRHVVASSRRG